LIALLGFGHVELGLAPVATVSAPLPFEKLITGIALRARVNKEAPKSSPIAASDEVYAAGAITYRNNCAVCHGLPGRDPTAIAKGEFPKPPQLFKGKGVTDDPAGVTCWKVANGIRLMVRTVVAIERRLTMRNASTSFGLWPRPIGFSEAQRVPGPRSDWLARR